jgi:4'-phosphopantetheinyl transferase
LISTLLDGVCDVWSITLSKAPQDLGDLEAGLSATERERAAAFLVPAPRRQFVIARTALRSLLSRYLGISPSACNFEFNAHGKPSLKAPPQLRFNVSHSNDVVLIAIAKDLDVGIDVEVHRHVDNLDSLAASILCTADYALWLGCPVSERTATFYRVWTCKEAVAKAIGCGMAMDFKSLRIGFTPGHTAELISIGEPSRQVGKWSLRELESDYGYSAAIAACSPGLKVVQRRFSF